MSNQKNGLLSWYFKSNLLLRILFGLILGAICGIIFQDASGAIAFLKPFGDIFIRFLKMIMMPIIICTLIVGTSSISPSHLGKVGVKVIIFYMVTSLFAIIVGLLIGNIMAPGQGLELANIAGIAKEAKSPTLVEILLDIIPTNPFGSIAKGDVLPTICFCIFFGVALAFVKDSKDERIKHAGDAVFVFFEGMSEIMLKVVGWVMQYAPIGVFALIFIVFSKNGAEAFGPLASVTISVYVGLLIQILCVYCVICAIFRLSAIKFLSKVRPPMITAFVTRSSGATIPVSMETAEQMGVPKSIFGFTIPVGATINMDGTTIYLGVCAIFIANVVGVPLDLSQQFTIVITAVLASIGTAGVPGAGAIMLLMVLESVGLKVEAGSVVAIAYSMILGIDAILDMGRTSMNVVGDMIGAVVVAKSEKELDEKVYNS
ncbi:dicarboxylate/amino acid:cation symporter [Campylobacter sp. faydin G-24]|uniref:Dicarboxylate/amino acid:cation symporter n=1 Tax=Campylobacter anatolicus TaxID=2829105 RepID=A0ABS5HG40_9BACT|nr:dicarboxylate/amino acid:cation symporter [Campylobacter anatolicus]MBR8463078.1 dicarboxylate/amino acid:cation symporter [Campylobacter anatolicus]